MVAGPERIRKLTAKPEVAVAEILKSSSFVCLSGMLVKLIVWLAGAALAPPEISTYSSTLQIS